MYSAIKICAVIVCCLLVTGCSHPRFHVKVIDQNGNSVPDVSVQLGVLSNFILASGGSTEFYTTDADGRFKIGGPRSFIRLIQKNGYEFENGKGFGSYSIYSNYADYGRNPPDKKNAYSNPYYILAWKRKEPELLIGADSLRGIKLFPDSQYYKINFTNKGIYREKIDQSGNIDSINAVLLVRYEESKEIVLNRQGKEMHPWVLTLAVPQGGLVKTDDIIRNLAPKDGYQQEWTIRSTDFSYINTTFTKKFYLKSKDGQVYGQFEIKLLPLPRSLRFESYWLNFNASRNLARPKKYVYCNSHFWPSRCSLDDYGP